MINCLFAGSRSIKTGIESIEVTGIQLILCDTESFAKSLEVYNFTFPQEFDGSHYIRLCNQAQDIVIGGAGFLLCDAFLNTNSVKGGEKCVQKLKNYVLDRMLCADLTKAEIDFIIEISHYQEESGRVHGVYYKTICEAIGISYETFYITMRSLEEKGFLQLEKSHYTDWDIIIKDNDFSYAGALKEGYISTGHDFFYADSFKSLKAKEKLLAMQLLKISGANKRYKIGMEIFFSKYEKLLKVTKRTIQTYLCSLKKFFKISVKNKLYIFVPLQECFKYNAPGDLQNLSNHLFSVACRRNRATYTA